MTAFVTLSFPWDKTIFDSHTPPRYETMVVSLAVELVKRRLSIRSAQNILVVYEDDSFRVNAKHIRDIIGDVAVTVDRVERLYKYITKVADDIYDKVRNKLTAGIDHLRIDNLSMGGDKVVLDLSPIRSSGNTKNSATHGV